jgi:hypothetical protein
MSLAIGIILSVGVLGTIIIVSQFLTSMNRQRRTSNDILLLEKIVQWAVIATEHTITAKGVDTDKNAHARLMVGNICDYYHIPYVHPVVTTLISRFVYEAHATKLFIHRSTFDKDEAYQAMITFVQDIQKKAEQNGVVLSIAELPSILKRIQDTVSFVKDQKEK